MAEMTEDARLAIYGYNAATGKAYTPEESAAANAGYNPYAGYTEAKFDPVKGEVTAINPTTGQTMTLGAKFRTSATGNIIPAESSRPPGVGYDDSGKPYQPGDRMPGETIEQWVGRLSQIGPGVIFDKGKAIHYNSRGMFYTEGEQPMPEDFADTLENMAGTPYAMRAAANVAARTGGSSAFTTQSTGATGGNLGNPYTPGTQQYTDFNNRKSAYDLLYEQFSRYGLGSLVAPLKDLITSGTSPSEFTIKLRETPAYKQRFAANDMRIANGFAAIDEATYLALEDKYQSLMQNYGLPASYYAKGELGTQEGFTKLIANNVDPITAEERILEGKKLTNSTKQTLDAAKQFYPSLTDGDILAYVLDPKNALSDIKRKVTAAEIGGAQIGAGLAASAANAEALAGAGVTGAKYLQAAPFISEASQRGSELASFYGMQPYDQASAEAEALNLAGSAQAAKKRRDITARETAEFSGTSGLSQGALDRGRQGAI